MRTQDLMEFAVTLADHFPNLIRVSRRLDEPSLQQYWVASQSRFNIWGTKLRLATDQMNATRHRSSRMWTAWAPMFEELLVSDTGTRIWASMLYSLDDRLGLTEYSPIGRSVLRGNDDARSRVVNLILKGQKANNAVAMRLGNLRLGIERWTDMLLAHASRDLANIAFSYDRKRYAHYVEMCEDGVSLRISTVQSGIAAAIGRTSVIPSHVDMHVRMNSKILASLGPELSIPAMFQDDDVWQSRLLSLADDTEKMIERWMQSESQ